LPGPCPPATDPARIVADHLGLTFAATVTTAAATSALTQPYELEVQPNAIPGDDDERDLYDPDRPEAGTLLLVAGPHRVTTLDTALISIDALVLLTREPS
jgi:hypothetical protein